jgi:hypothetical protein
MCKFCIAVNGKLLWIFNSREIVSDGEEKSFEKLNDISGKISRKIG